MLDQRLFESKRFYHLLLFAQDLCLELSAQHSITKYIAKLIQIQDLKKLLQLLPL